jgi:hypothetical protein
MVTSTSLLISRNLLYPRLLILSLVSFTLETYFPAIIDKRELDIWSNDYFLQLADMIVFTHKKP